MSYSESLKDPLLFGKHWKTASPCPQITGEEMRNGFENIVSSTNTVATCVQGHDSLNRT